MHRLMVMADARSVHTERWCRYFEEQGWTVALFSLEPQTITSPRVFFGAGRPTGIGVIDYYLAQKRCRRALDEFRPDIVNSHYVVSYGWLAALERRCPMVATAWGSDLLLLPQKSIAHRKRIARALRLADCCTVDGRNLHAVAAQYIPPDKIVRILLGVKRSLLETTATREYRATGRLEIISPRGLQPVYDPETIVRAAELLKGTVDIHIDLRGNGRRAKKYQRKISRASLEEIITLRERTANHDQYVASLEEYDIFLSASLSDSTSVALLEAMAVGLFPVVSDIEGNREWIEHGHNGLLFEPGSAPSLAGAIREAIARRPEFASIAAVNRKLIEREAIWEDNMQRVKDLFEKLAGR